MRRVFLVAFLTVAVVAGCGSTTSTGGGGGGGGPTSGGGGGNVHATVTFNSQTYNLSGGVCEDAGVLGWEVKVGDYEAEDADFLDVIVSSTQFTSAQGKAGGVPWALAAGKQSGTIDSNRNGSFEGTDFVSGKPVSGTFGCG